MFHWVFCGDVDVFKEVLYVFHIYVLIVSFIFFSCSFFVLLGCFGAVAFGDH